MSVRTSTRTRRSLFPSADRHRAPRQGPLWFMACLRAAPQAPAPGLSGAATVGSGHVHQRPGADGTPYVSHPPRADRRAPGVRCCRRLPLRDAAAQQASAAVPARATHTPRLSPRWLSGPGRARRSRPAVSTRRRAGRRAEELRSRRPGERSGTSGTLRARAERSARTANHLRHGARRWPVGGRGGHGDPGPGTCCRGRLSGALACGPTARERRGRKNCSLTGRMAEVLSLM